MSDLTDLNENSNSQSGATDAFDILNVAYNTTFKPNKLSLGLVVPIETYSHTAVPTMIDHLERVKLAEALGFAAVWLRLDC